MEFPAFHFVPIASFPYGSEADRPVVPQISSFLSSFFPSSELSPVSTAFERSLRVA